LVSCEEKTGRTIPDNNAVKHLEAVRPVKGLDRERAIADQTLYHGRAKYSGLDVNEARRLRALEEENRRWKTLVADLSLDREALKAVIPKNGRGS
jgi:putative transposase